MRRAGPQGGVSPPPPVSRHGRLPPRHRHHPQRPTPVSSLAPSSPALPLPSPPIGSPSCAPPSPPPLLPPPPVYRPLPRTPLRLPVGQYTAAHDADRADLARRQVFLPSGAGGLGLRHLSLAASAPPSTPPLPTASGPPSQQPPSPPPSPAVAAVDLSSDPTTLPAPAAAFAAAFATCTAAHSTVADTYRPLDAARHHHVTGATRPFYRPSCPVDRAFPALTDLFADRTAGTIVHPS